MPLRANISSIILFSVFSSNEFVASSNTKISGELYKALAIEILWICPPDSCEPPSPTIVFIPLGKSLINLSRFENFIASNSFSLSISSSFSAKAIFLAIVLFNKKFFPLVKW